MRYLAGLLAGTGQADAAMPELTLDRSAVAGSPVEEVLLLSPPLLWL
jgi:hypothetical protein